MLPRTPMRGGMGPRMMGPGFGGKGPMMGMNRMQRNPMMNPMMRGPGQMGQGGGLLSRIFGRGNAGGMSRLGGMAGTPGAGSSGSIMQALSNPGGLTSILNNTQQVLKTAQTISPMIQQYGPLVKNLPAMWKLFRGLKDATSDTEETTPSKEGESHFENESESSEKNQPKTSKKSTLKKKEHSTRYKKTSVKEKGASIPKMYI
ncbi:MAG TPA: VrrA/YqfQ family protein [Bacillales bacterium]|nr:VrrA/YqfQ family protein [Bacillales bacterium]